MIKTNQPKEFVNKFKKLINGETVDEQVQILYSKIVKSLEIEVKGAELKTYNIESSLIDLEMKYNKALLNNGSFIFSFNPYIKNIKDILTEIAEKETELKNHLEYIKFLKSQLKEVKK